jgi:hypothetical protein
MQQSIATTDACMQCPGCEANTSLQMAMRSIPVQTLSGAQQHPAAEYKLEAADLTNRMSLSVGVFVRSPGGATMIWEVVNCSSWQFGQGRYQNSDKWAASLVC